MSPIPETLPVLAAREAILAAMAHPGALILSAPPGTGKSTQVPRFFLDGGPGQILVLQPRRIAARTLAARVAEEIGEPLGKSVGYQVRFESVAGPDTRILFQTYGTFRQRLMRDPELAGIRAVVLDEFHERAWEADLALLWCRHLRRSRRPDLRLVVMSATLDETGLAAYLPAVEKISIEGRVFPVEIRHQGTRMHESLPQQVLRALKSLPGDSGSILVFLPGGAEIRGAAEQVSGFCREAGLKLRELHGSMPLDAQREALKASSASGGAVILATNVAETSLTVPGITAVIDSGLHRVAAYDPERDLSTLYLKPISMANAVQRAGRAGRLAPGTCIRLWEQGREAHMAKSLDPEIHRVELSEAALAFHALRAFSPSAKNEWPTAPDPGLWEQAEAKLARIGALQQGSITELGKSLMRWPAPPELARVLHDAAALDPVLRRQAAAMAAILSSGKPAKDSNSDLFALGEELAEARRNDLNRETADAFRQFLGQMEKGSGGSAPAGAKSLRQRASELFLPVYADRLAARVGNTRSFILADGRKGTASTPADVRLLLALEIHESGGKDKVRLTTLPLYLPVEAASVEAAFPGACSWTSAEEFDAAKGKVLREERLIFRGLVLDRRESTPAKGANASDLLFEQVKNGEIKIPLDDEAKQWVYRIQLAHRVLPDQGLPAMDEEEWELIHHEICSGKTSAKQLLDVSVSAALKDYLGPALVSFLEREAPTEVKLPQGKRGGKITYFENNPPEIAARLGDFLGMEGAFKILKGRVEVTYDILAPNYRTVQKTRDLSSFWKNSYPEVKKELKRRYPRHPWP